MLFPKISAENVHSWYPYKQFWPKTQTARWNCLKTMPFLLYIICLIVTVFRFVGAKLHFRFHNLSVLTSFFYWISDAKYLSDIKLNVSFSWHISSLGFSLNTNRLPSDNAQERIIRFKIDPFTKCQTDTVKKHTPFQYILALTLVT